MKKPKEAIERMRDWMFHETNMAIDLRSVLAYLDSIPDDAIPVVWPKELDRDYLESLVELADDVQVTLALHALAAIAPERKKRIVNVWKRNSGSTGFAEKLSDFLILETDCEGPGKGWRKVAGPVEIDE